ncbi:MAG TPA: amino acid permease [Gemmataceae bacterium]|jgi:APA family basic amino acid/polyamine antiporter|nr:amino acid permease [Gemmataceae bacterium]
MANQLFAKKSLEAILKEMAGEHRLKRALGPVTLTALGIGAVIGAGIFVATGAAAKDVAGPALMLSYLFAGITCIFAALCYAEFAAMAPVAGSAYTYAYTTLGELFAWIIGWDLVLEYAVGAATVANSWSGYLQSVLGSAGIVLPMALVGAPEKYDQGHILPNMVAKIDGHSVSQMVIKEKEANWPDGSVKPAEGVFWVRIKERLSSEAEAEKDAQGHMTVLGPVEDKSIGDKASEKQYALFNLPAVFITFIMTLILIKGISESAGFNAIMVAIKVAAVLFVVVVGGYYVNPTNWTKDFAPYGWTGVSLFGWPILGQTNAAGDPVGVLAGAAIIFFAYIGFDAVSTQAEEAKNPQRDVPIGIIASLLICTILYIAVVAVLTGMVPYQDLSKDAGVSDAFKGIGMKWAQVIVAIAGVAGITSVLLVMMLSAPRVFLAMARDGLVPKGIFARIHPKFQTPWISTILIGVFVAVMTAFLPITALLHLTNIGTLFAFVIVCAAVLIMRRINPGAVRPFRCPLVPIVPILGIAFCLLLMLSLPPANWYRLIGWLALGLFIYFGYGKRHSLLGKQLRGELSTHGVSGAGMLDQGNK